MKNSTNQQIQFSLSPVIKVVGPSCNLRCPYCFYEGHQQTKLQIMSEDVLKVILEKLFKASTKSIRFIWHGGEPLLAGYPFYEKVVQLQQKFISNNQIVWNSIQTNGTLIDEKSAKFFVKHNFGVGVSLDGPKHIHDYTRQYSSGKGSFEKVMKGIRTLQDVGMITGVIAVINSYSVNYPDEIFNFFYKNKLSFNANDCVASCDDPQVAKDLAVNPVEYARFLLRIFDLWLETGDTNFKIKPLNDFICAAMGQHLQLCKFKGRCEQYLTIDTNGDVYPCSDYMKSNYVLGNLVDSTFEEIVSNNKYKNHYSIRPSVLSLCEGCEWINACQGWCQRTWNIDLESDDPRNQLYCEALKILFSDISSKLNSLGYNTIKTNGDLYSIQMYN